MSAFTFRPGTLLGLPLDQLTKELDTHLPRLYDAHNTLLGIAVQAPALNGSFATVSGSATFTGSKLNIPTGLQTVSTITATIIGAVATNIVVTAQVTPANLSQINLFAWQPTSSSVNTPITCTSATTVHWTCTGVNTLNAPSTA